MQPYIYQPLDEAKQEIRYLTLLPDAEEGQIQVTLTHMSLQRFQVQDQNAFGWELKHELDEAQAVLPEGWVIENNLEGRLIYWRRGDARTTTWTHPNPSFTDENIWKREQKRERAPFEALSYTWGDPTPVQPIVIICENVKYQLLVTQNLFETLHYLRLRDKPRQLWVDSVCINQQDLLERSSQVARMDKIYGLTRQVTVWLGPEAADSSLAIQKLQYLGDQMEYLKNRFGVATPGCVDPHLFVNKNLSLDEDIWKAIKALLSRKWFERVWVKQEISLAPPSSIFICGSSTITWHAFRRALLFLGGQSQTILPNIHNLSDLAFGLSGLDPLVVLRSLTRSRCFDPHDRIYGILALVAKSWASRIPVSYKMSTQKLYWKTLLADLAVNARLDLLDLAGPLLKQSEIIHFDLPSERHLTSGFSPPSHEKIDEYYLAILGRDNAIEAARRWYFEHKQHHVGDDFARWKETFVRTICQNLTLDRYEVGCPSVESWQAYILKGDPKITGPVEQNVIEQLDKKTLVIFEDGSFGLGPLRAQIGDQLFVISGAQCPYLLRPQTDGTHLVVGSCYVHDLMSGEALLGPLPEDWKLARISDGSRRVWRFLNDKTGQKQREDPRLGPLPKDWEFLQEDAYEQQYGNLASGRKMWSDPRMSEEALEARGVEVEAIAIAIWPDNS